MAGHGRPGPSPAGQHAPGQDCQQAAARGAAQLEAAPVEPRQPCNRPAEGPEPNEQDQHRHQPAEQAVPEPQVEKGPADKGVQDEKQGKA